MILYNWCATISKVVRKLVHYRVATPSHCLSFHLTSGLVDPLLVLRIRIQFAVMLELCAVCNRIGSQFSPLCLFLLCNRLTLSYCIEKNKILRFKTCVQTHTHMYFINMQVCECAQIFFGHVVRVFFYFAFDIFESCRVVRALGAVVICAIS